MNQFESVADYLPESVQGIIAAIGLSATEKLIRVYGGTVIRISRNYTIFDKLSQLLGCDEAIKLREYVKGDEIYIPYCHVALRELRNQQIYADFCHLTQQDKLSGRATMMRICPKYKVSDRTVWEIVRKFQRKNNNPQQNKLF